jgi:circadian clock protein KaiB
MSARPIGTNILRLFIAGANVRSQQAILYVRHLCEGEFKGNSTLEVIDIYQQPKLARINQIVATPTLIKEYPKPVRRYIGNLAGIDDLVPEMRRAPEVKAPR